MLSYSDNVAIIGAGLAGLAAALSLHGLSIKCSVFEMRNTNAAPPKSSGALMLAPNALKILDQLGVYSEIKKKGYLFEHVYYKNADEQTTERYPFGNESAFGYKALRIYRQDLLDVLYTACVERSIPIHFGKKFAKVVDESDTRVTFSFTDGSTETASLLIGSDGIHSKLRDYVIPGVEKKFVGLAALTWETPTEQLRIPEDKDYKFPVTVLTANGAFVLAPQKPDGSAMLAGTQIAIEDKNREGWDTFMADKEALVARVTTNLEVWPDIAKSSMEVIDRDTMNVWPFYAIPRLPNWTSPKYQRVVILGDAAHAIPPTTGQGASQAFEDVTSLALILAAVRENVGLEWGEALKYWQRMRQDRIDDLLVLTRQLNNKRLPPEKQALLPKEDLWFDESATNPNQMSWLYAPKIEEAIKSWTQKAL
ncbi:FAD dependent oxidoreductase [Xylaria bambusicola]|uniref:FAD dependent oxidoreductase n=1 Tax=Xylaria bambusicola TaxID=326684 RepID=UPI0020077A57|nr:FAD dependent oxidoreductase [Xylaria bambusicola]KAI0521293.1 FAD dependent oxidoreductase [Xylaria bambusicola]